MISKGTAAHAAVIMVNQLDCSAAVGGTTCVAALSDDGGIKGCCNLRHAWAFVAQDNMARIILENGITHVVHFATLLSGAPPAQQAAVACSALATEESRT
jgi:hypothetical protein